MEYFKKVSRLFKIGTLFFVTAVFLKDSLFYMEASEKTENLIRIGITGEFYNRPSLKIENLEVKIGFSKKNRYYPVDTLRSPGGFEVKKAGKSYRVLNGSYRDFKEALAEAKRLFFMEKRSAVLPALTGMDKSGKGVWKLYEEASALQSTPPFPHFERSGIPDGTHLLHVNMREEDFLIDGGEAGGYPQFVPVKREGLPLISLERKRYRGRMEIGTFGRNGVTPVNIVDLNDYVKGVISMEMSDTWPMAALKAQAVCARSFGVSTSGYTADSSLKRGYRLTNSIAHQSYGGYNVEKERTNRAVEETRDEFVTYKNKVVRTFYYSSSGGSSEDSENVWGGSMPYLRTVPDIYEDMPAKKPWTVRLSERQVAVKLASVMRKRGVRLGKIRSLQVTKTSKSGRVLSLRVSGDEGELTLLKGESRTVFSLPSTKFEVFSDENDAGRVKVLRKKEDGIYKSATDLRGSYAVEKGGKLTKFREDGERQIMALGAENRKGYYTGKIGLDTFLFVGTGFGHGVGFSQSGAKGMAEAGFGYKKILMHYFKGTEVN